MNSNAIKTGDFLTPTGNKKRPNSLSVPETPHRDGPRGSILKRHVKYDSNTVETNVKTTEKQSTKLESNDQKKQLKGGKLTFSEELNQVKEVDNWKKYNVEDGNYNKSCCNTF